MRVLTANLERFDRVIACNMGLHDLRDVPVERAPALRKLLEETPVLAAEEMMRTLQEVTRKLTAGPDADERAVFYRVFMFWRKHCAEHAGFDPSEILRRWLVNPTDEEIKAYAAPFPSEEYLQGARQFPSLVPIFPDDPAISANRRAWEILHRFEKPFLTAYDNPNSVEAPRFQQEIPGARGRNHVVFENAGHLSPGRCRRGFRASGHRVRSRRMPPSTKSLPCPARHSTSKKPSNSTCNGPGNRIPTGVGTPTRSLPENAWATISS